MFATNSSNGQNAAHGHASDASDVKLDRDLAVLARFIEIYCHGKHAADARQTVALRSHDVAKIAGHSLDLCPDCTKLLNHALVKRCACTMQPKPQCKHCPRHCYAPVYREQIKDVMKYAGPRMVMRGRVDYLLHLLF